MKVEFLPEKEGSGRIPLLLVHQRSSFSLKIIEVCSESVEELLSIHIMYIYTENTLNNYFVVILQQKESNNNEFPITCAFLINYALTYYSNHFDRRRYVA